MNAHAGIYGVDVSDPREPQDMRWHAGTSLSCSWLGCEGADVSGSGGLLLDSYELALVSLPDAYGPTWLFRASSDPERINISLTRLSSDRVAVGSSEWGGVDLGYLTVVSTSNGAPLVVSEVQDTYAFDVMTSVDGRLFTLDEDVSGDYHAIRVYELGNPAQPTEIARPSFVLPTNFITSSIAVRKQDLFTLSGEFTLPTPGEEPTPVSWINWYRFSDDWATLKLRGTYNKRPANAYPLVPIEGYVVAGVRGTDADPDASRQATLVLRLDTSAGLVVASDTPRGGLGQIVIDEQRGLVYVGGVGAMQVLDLGIITSGAPRWPEEE